MGNLLNLNLRKIQYFLAVVDEGSITNAANKLYVTQPLLSKSIAELERDLDIVLFNRDKRLLSLTAAGKSLYDSWSVVIGQVLSAIDTARDIHMGNTERIVLAYEYVMVLGANDLWLAPLQQFLADHPKTKVNIKAANHSDVMSRFLAHECDMFIGSPYMVKGLDRRFCTGVICELPAYLFTGSQNPFIKERGFNFPLEELQDQEFLTIYPNIARFPQDTLVDFGRGLGFTPKIAGYMESQLTQLPEVKSGNKWILAAGIPSMLNDPALVGIPLEGVTTEITLTWHRDSSPIVRKLAEYLTEGKQLKELD